MKAAWSILGTKQCSTCSPSNQMMQTGEEFTWFRLLLGAVRPVLRSPWHSHDRGSHHSQNSRVQELAGDQSKNLLECSGSQMQDGCQVHHGVSSWDQWALSISWFWVHGFSHTNQNYSEIIILCVLVLNIQDIQIQFNNSISDSVVFMFLRLALIWCPGWA